MICRGRPAEAIGNAASKSAKGRDEWAAESTRLPKFGDNVVRPVLQEQQAERSARIKTVGVAGLESVADSSEKTQSPMTGNAQSDAHSKIEVVDPDLVRLIDAWPTLSLALQRAILSLIDLEPSRIGPTSNDGSGGE